MSRLYLDAYDAAVLRYWGELLSRHHRSLRRPYATGRVLEHGDEGDGDGRAPNLRDGKRARPAGEPGGHGV